MVRSVLIANRGEIARRIIRTAKPLGVETIAVYSDIDEESLFVQDADKAVKIGEARPKDSYLNMDKIITAAGESGATAIHPGYGFLSERWEFAQRCETEGLIFIGPSSEVIHKMGDKYRSRQIASSLAPEMVQSPTKNTHYKDGLQSLHSMAAIRCTARTSRTPHHGLL